VAETLWDLEIAQPDVPTVSYSNPSVSPTDFSVRTAILNWPG